MPTIPIESTSSTIGQSDERRDGRQEAPLTSSGARTGLQNTHAWPRVRTAFKSTSASVDIHVRLDFDRQLAVGQLQSPNLINAPQSKKRGFRYLDRQDNAQRVQWASEESDGLSRDGAREVSNHSYRARGLKRTAGSNGSGGGTDNGAKKPRLHHRSLSDPIFDRQRRASKSPTEREHNRDTRARAAVRAQVTVDIDGDSVDKNDNMEGVLEDSSEDE